MTNERITDWEPLAQANQREIAKLTKDLADAEKLVEILANTAGELEQRIEELEVAAADLHAANGKLIGLFLSLRDSIDALVSAFATGLGPGQVVAFVRRHVADEATKRASRVSGRAVSSRRAGLGVIPGGLTSKDGGAV